MRKRSLNHTLFDWHFIGWGLWTAALHFHSRPFLWSFLFLRIHRGQWQWALASVNICYRQCAKPSDSLDILIVSTKAINSRKENKISMRVNDRKGVYKSDQEAKPLARQSLLSHCTLNHKHRKLHKKKLLSHKYTLTLNWCRVCLRHRCRQRPKKAKT